MVLYSSLVDKPFMPWDGDRMDEKPLVSPLRPKRAVLRNGTDANHGSLSRASAGRLDCDEKESKSREESELRRRLGTPHRDTVVP